MNKLKLLLLVGAMFLASIFIKSVFATTVNYNINGHVAICHATASNSNPYVSESPDVQNDGSYAGMNWPTGMAIWTNNCSVASATPTPTPTATPTVTPSPTPTPTPTPSTAKVTICHYDAGQGGKYTSNDVSMNSVNQCQNVNGHDGHANDIIPPFSNQFCSYPGKNWTAQGQAIYNNGTCDGSTATPTPSPTPSGSPTPTPTPTPGNNNNNGGGSGGGSTFVCTVGKPGTPLFSSVVQNGPDSVKLTWVGVPGVTDYKIEYGLSSNNYIYGVPSTGNVTTYVIGSLDLSKSYFFRIIAVNGCAQGDPSLELQTAFGGPVRGLSNTSSQDDSIKYLIASVALIFAGFGLFVKNSILKNA